MSSFSVICWQEVLVVCVWKHCQMGRVLCQDVAECNVYWNWWREYWLKLPRARNRLVLTERDYSSSQCFWNTGAYLTYYRLFYDYVHVVRLNNGIMFHCRTVKYKALKVDPVQSHFVSQYDGGQLGQRDLWHLSDQSFFFTVTYYLPVCVSSVLETEARKTHHSLNHCMVIHTWRHILHARTKANSPVSMGASLEPHRTVNTDLYLSTH